MTNLSKPETDIAELLAQASNLERKAEQFSIVDTHMSPEEARDVAKALRHTYGDPAQSVNEPDDARYFEFRRKVECLVFDPIRRGQRTEPEILAQLERMCETANEVYTSPPSGAPGVPSDETIGVAVDVVLREGVWPENIREDDRGLERDEYIEFVTQVLIILAASPPPVPPQERPYPIEKFKTLTDRARNSIEGQNWATENMGVAEYAAIDMAVMFVVAELTGRSLADWLTSQPGQSQEESGPR